MSVTGASDSWDYPASSSTLSISATRTVTTSVKDDWDDDDEEEEEDPQKVWEDANKRAPMPELVISSQGATAIPPPPAALQPSLRILKRPPASGSASSHTASSPAIEQQKSYAEREAQYQVARERIFGDSGSPGSASAPSAIAHSNADKAGHIGPHPNVGAKIASRDAGTVTGAGVGVNALAKPRSRSHSPQTVSLQTVPAVTIVREPRGPDTDLGATSGTGRGGARGFRGRRNGGNTNGSGPQGPPKQTSYTIPRT